MPSRRSANSIVGYGVLGAAAITSFLLPETLTPPVLLAGTLGPGNIHLMGIVRDFPSAHPDFGLIMSSGHYAGIVDWRLGEDQLPVLTGGGYAVDVNWTNSAGNPIAPHVYQTAAEFDNGGGNGPRPVLLVVANSDALTADDLACGALIESWGHAVTVIDDGASDAELDVVLPFCDVAFIRADADDVNIKDQLVNAPIGIVNASSKVRHRLGWPPSTSRPIEATDIYLSSTDHCLTDHMAPGTYTLYTSPQPMKPTNEPYDSGSFMLGTESATSTRPLLQALDVGDLLHDGTYAAGRRVQLPWGYSKGGFDFSSLTADAKELMRRALEWSADPTIACGLPPCHVIADAPGVAGADGSGGITSSATFADWFTSVPSVNRSRGHEIRLKRDANGVYDLWEPDFRPIDMKLLGNEGEDKNNNFTFALKAEFVFSECVGQFLEVAGGDGLWVFINDELVIDLGGFQTGTRQHIELDRLGLDPGQTYSMHMFYAQRHSGTSPLLVRTNLRLSTSRILPASGSEFD